MSPRSPLSFLTLAVALFALAACGGGGGPDFGGGISGTGKPTVTVGTITDATMLTVAGTTFQTTMTNVTISGTAGATADLRVGMTAKVLGVEDGGVIEAESVVVDEIVKGTLQAKPDATTLVVFGQTIGVDATTVYGPGISPASPAGLVLGDQLEVYGYVLSSGLAFATRIEREDSLSSLRLVGFASNVNLAAETFQIGAQVVDYASADTSDLPGGVPQNGQLVEARGLPVLGMGGELLATEVKLQDLDDDEDNDRTEIEGYVTDVVNPMRFLVGGVIVDTTAGTVYEGGTALDVAVGVRVEVEGDLASGVLVARKVEFESDVRLESDVATVSGSTITLVGLPGISIAVTALTEFDGDAASLGDIAPGDHVEIRGRASGASSVDAAQVKETSADTDVEIQGPVDASPAPSDPTLSILGLSIDTSSIPNNDFQGPGELVIGRSAFFAALEPGLLVRVSGELGGGVPTWDEAEIESQDDD